MKLVKRMMLAAAMMALTVAGSSMQANAGKFNAAYYATTYPDVYAAFGADEKALYNHYVTCGQKEGRIPYSGALKGEMLDEMIGTNQPTSDPVNAKGKFNPVHYALTYPDVKAALGTDAQKLYNHYVANGQKEGRIPYPGASAGEAVNGIATQAEMAQQSARSAVTYYVKYSNKDGWRYQVGTWNEGGSNKEAYYLKDALQDGDKVVVDGNAGVPDVDALKLNVSVSLSNVTFVNKGKGNITAKSIENVFVLKDSLGIVNGNVTNAYVYDNATAQFNNDVAYLFIKKDTSNKQTAVVSGTVGCMQILDKERVTSQLFSFDKGKFEMREGTLYTSEKNYRK